MRFWNSTLATFMLLIMLPIFPTIVAKMSTPARKSATTNTCSSSFSGCGVSPVNPTDWIKMVSDVLCIHFINHQVKRRADTVQVTAKNKISNLRIVTIKKPTVIYCWIQIKRTRLNKLIVPKLVELRNKLLAAIMFPHTLQCPNSPNIFTFTDNICILSTRFCIDHYKK